MEKATFGAGCFWGVEDSFSQLKGVIETTVGYSGGHQEFPTYQQVCSGDTGHAEVVEITFDPDQISFDDLLETFWASHDPTQVNRQGPDVGEQYRSVIFYHSEDQRQTAEDSKQRLDSSGKLNKPVATQIVPVKEFFKAEEYHQKYNQKQKSL